ncbi:hypothetical protein ACFL7D_01415 [candidate division KSB1 bacterium]
MKNLDLKKIEKKAFLSVSQDGLFDIFIGYMFLVLGVSGLTEGWFPSQDANSIVSMVFMLSGPVFFMLAKKFIIAPRIGEVKFGQKRKMARKKVIIILALFIIITSLSGNLFINDTLPNSPLMSSLTMGVVIFIPLSIAAYYFNNTRLYFTAFLAALVEVMYNYAGGYIGICILGSVIILIGLTVFINFLKKHPVQNLNQVNI